MTFESKKFNEIFEDMRGRTPVVTDFEVGSVARTIYESFAFEIALLYEKMNLVYLSAFVDTAEGQQLDQVVSILGIQRGLPDFAEGVVTFERDVGNEDIVIPLGTLVATEDTPENPKKVYQTFEPKTLAKDQTSVDVKVQAVERGEDQVTPAETIVVMPRPIPGIKAVINREPLNFLGKRRETDKELRERAKNALISAGKATIVSIENALLSMSGVKDVQVKEHFHFARGEVVFQRLSGSGDITIPKPTQLTATVAGRDKSFETTEQVVLADGESSIEVNVQSLLEGKPGEVPGTTSTGVSWRIDTTGLEPLNVSNTQPILLGDFGIIEVFVDGPELTEPSEKERIQKAIDKVRAAGILVLLNAASKVHLDGVFKIAINSALSLSDEERAEFEKTVRDEIVNFISELKLGETFSFSKLIKNILSSEGIEDLEDFRITAIKQGVSTPTQYDFSSREITIEEFERFNPRYICVASEEKSLLVNIQFKADGLDNSKRDDILNVLGSYFGGLALGEAVSRNEIENRISSVSGITLVADTLKLMLKSWCQRPLIKEQAGDEIVDVSFVERTVLGDVFAYHSFLEITGALKLTLPFTLTNAEKQTIRSEIRTRIEGYLDSLKAEEDVVFDDLVSITSEMDRVLAVDLDEQDFRVEINGAEAPERVTEDKIEVAPFEKAKLTYFCITGDVETVEISVTTLELTVLDQDPPTPELQNALKEAVTNTINNFLSEAVAGEDLIYENLKSAIEGLVTGVSYQVTQLSLEAEALCDGRMQIANIATAKNIHIRSVDLPVMIPITATDVNLILPPGGGS